MGTTSAVNQELAIKHPRLLNLIEETQENRVSICIQVLECLLGHILWLWGTTTACAMEGVAEFVAGEGVVEGDTCMLTIKHGVTLKWGQICEFVDYCVDGTRLGYY